MLWDLGSHAASQMWALLRCARPGDFICTSLFPDMFVALHVTDTALCVFQDSCTCVRIWRPCCGGRYTCATHVGDSSRRLFRHTLPIDATEQCPSCSHQFNGSSFARCHHRPVCKRREVISSPIMMTNDDVHFGVHNCELELSTSGAFACIL